MLGEPLFERSFTAIGYHGRKTALERKTGDFSSAASSRGSLDVRAYKAMSIWRIQIALTHSRVLHVSRLAPWNELEQATLTDPCSFPILRVSRTYARPELTSVSL